MTSHAMLQRWVNTQVKASIERPQILGHGQEFACLICISKKKKKSRELSDEKGSLCTEVTAPRASFESIMESVEDMVCQSHFWSEDHLKNLTHVGNDPQFRNQSTAAYRNVNNPIKDGWRKYMFQPDK
jgi:hypothetical protein